MNNKMIVLENESIKEHCYFKTGKNVAELYLPESLQELSEVRKSLKGKPHFFIGGGTNSMVWEKDFAGAVISVEKMDYFTRKESDQVIAGGGLDNTQFSKLCLENKLDGASWMNRLPGQLAPTVRMNARCYGGEISQIAKKIVGADQDGSIKEFWGSEVFHGYKNTLFMTDDICIGEIHFQLQKGNPDKIKAHMEHCESDRVQKNQFEYPSCGCVFKNNYEVGVPSGMLLEASGVKDLKVGGANINPKHANFIFNTEYNGNQVFELSKLMREAVYDHFGVWLEYEMEILGPIPHAEKEYIHSKKDKNWNQSKINELKKKFKSK